MREKLMELMGWCYEANERIGHKIFVNYNGVGYDDISVGYFQDGEITYILPYTDLTVDGLERLDYAIERLKEFAIGAREEMKKAIDILLDIEME